MDDANNNKGNDMSKAIQAVIDIKAATPGIQEDDVARKLIASGYSFGDACEAVRQAAGMKTTHPDDHRANSSYYAGYERNAFDSDYE